ncbi:L-rhamnose mutarotase [Pedobacter sp. GR22-6]|uniref:L-rhamnose mutarotase n=1 Tax=Pedobacter sp. GR22-6 TaxID=3127957 RepID=UPI00307E7E6B
MKRYCLALDLIDDPKLIEAYEHWHKAGNGWPEIRENITRCGILDMQIYRSGNRLTMIMETLDDFTFEEQAKLMSANPKVQDWEKMMSGYQQPLPWAKPGEKWLVMDQIFQL